MPKRRTRRKTRRRKRIRNRSRRTKRRRRRRRSRRGAGGLEGLGRIREMKEREARIKGVEAKDKRAIKWEGWGKKVANPTCHLGTKGPHRVGLLRTAGREHHCRSCGKIVCDKHSKGRQKIYRWPIGQSISQGMFRSCDKCVAKENKAIDEVKKAAGVDEKKAIQALRRAMFENCKQTGRKDSRKYCRSRPFREDQPRLPTPGEISKAISFANDDNSDYGSDSPGRWHVKSHINKLYPAPKREKEKEELLAYRVAKVAGLVPGPSPKARGRAAARDRQ